jgi:hypothetical protein
MGGAGAKRRLCADPARKLDFFIPLLKLLGLFVSRRAQRGGLGEAGQAGKWVGREAGAKEGSDVMPPRFFCQQPARNKREAISYCIAKSRARLAAAGPYSGHAALATRLPRQTLPLPGPGVTWD